MAATWFCKSASRTAAWYDAAHPAAACCCVVGKWKPPPDRGKWGFNVLML